jgi:hypothetical protein
MFLDRGERNDLCMLHCNTHWEKKQNVAVCYRVQQLPITTFVALYVTGFNGCRSLHLWRCMIQGSTVADHCICGAVCYRVPQLPITAFVSLYVIGFRSCRSLYMWRCMLQGSTAADHCICSVGTSCLIGRDTTGFRIYIQALQHTDFVLMASDSYRAHTTVHPDRLLLFPQSLNNRHPPNMSLKIPQLRIFVYFNSFFNCINHRP